VVPDPVGDARLYRAVGQQVDGAGEESFDRVRAGRQQGVRVVALGNVLTRQRGVVQNLTLDDGELADLVDQDPGGQQAGQTSADDDGRVPHSRSSL
jgi:hypothetical protein